MSPLEKELEQLGFSEKESKVYFANLELGPATAQNIAKKAGVNRATTYVMIESLTKRGLMNSFEKGKKRFFSPETPERIEHLLKMEKDAVDAKMRGYAKILPELKSLFSSADERPRVRFYEGREGLESMREDLFRSKAAHVDDIISLDDYRAALPEEERLAHAKKIGEKKISGRALYTATDKAVIVTAEVQKYWEMRHIPSDKFPLSGEIAIYDNRVALLSYKGKLVGAIIESKEIAETARSIFNLAWSCATAG